MGVDEDGSAEDRVHNRVVRATNKRSESERNKSA